MPARFSPLLWAVWLGMLMGQSPCRATPPPPPDWEGFTLSRAAPSITLGAGITKTIVLRADRDVSAVKIELEPVSRDHSGSWDVRLVPLEATEEPVAPDFPRASQSKPIWQKAGLVSGNTQFMTTVRTPVPRRWFQNWLLTLVPKSEPTAPVRLQVRATLADQTERIRWLTLRRTEFDPEASPEAVRHLVRYLTDQEVAHWAGMATRRVFLEAWRRLTPEQIDAAFGAEYPVTRKRAQRLPNGLSLLVNGATPPRELSSLLLPEVTSKPAPRGEEQIGGALENPQIKQTRAGATTELNVAPAAPVYHLELAGDSRERQYRLRIHPQARSLAVRLKPLPASDAPLPYTLSLEITDLLEPAGTVPRPILQGIAAHREDGLPARGQPRVFRAELGLKPRTSELLWLVRIRTVPNRDQQSVPAVAAGLELAADTTPLADRERELMAWRDQIDPIAQPDAVREKIATLTDEEVQRYTGFKDRANFLKYWRRVKLMDLPHDDAGRLILDSDTIGLTSTGTPLPNGKYLHHNGRPVQLD